MPARRPSGAHAPTTPWQAMARTEQETPKFAEFSAQPKHRQSSVSPGCLFTQASREPKMMPSRSARKHSMQSTNTNGISGLGLDAEEDAVADKMRCEVLRFISLRATVGGVVCKDWAHLSEFRLPNKQGICFGCFSPVISLVACLRMPGPSQRRLTLCPRCGVIEDVPVGTKLEFHIGGDSVVQLTGDLPRKHWAATLVLQSKLPAESRMIAWPTDPAGGAASIVQLQNGLPIGPIEAMILVMWGADFAVLSQPMERHNYHWRANSDFIPAECQPLWLITPLKRRRSTFRNSCSEKRRSEWRTGGASRAEEVSSRIARCQGALRQMESAERQSWNFTVEL